MRSNVRSGSSSSNQRCAPFFMSIGPTIPEIWPIECRALEITSEILTTPPSNQVISMTSGLKLSCFVVIGWVVLTLSCRQIFFVNRCRGHDKLIENFDIRGKIVLASEGAAADAAKTNWKPNVTPGRGGLLMAYRRLESWSKFRWNYIKIQ